MNDYGLNWNQRGRPSLLLASLAVSPKNKMNSRGDDMQQWEYKRVLFAINMDIGGHFQGYSGVENGREVIRTDARIESPPKGFYIDGEEQNNTITDYLNRLGIDGWEIISSDTFMYPFPKEARNSPTNMRLEYTYLLLKRPIED